MILEAGYVIPEMKGLFSMTSDQLRYFITIVNLGSFMETALELNVSQSTVSKQIQVLEQELGVSLFDRSSRKARLTPEGQKLLPEIRFIMEKIEHLCESAAKLQPQAVNSFTVITLPFVGFLDLYTPFDRFEKEHPGLQLEIVELLEPQMMKRLPNNDFDVALTYEHEYQLSGFKSPFIPLTEDEAVFVVHKDHPLASLEAVTLEDIENLPLLLMNSHTCVAKLCEDYFSIRGLAPDIIFRGMPDTLIAGVEAKRGCAIMSKKQALNYIPKNVAIIPFSPSIPIVIGAIPNENSVYKEQIEDLFKIFSTAI